MDKYLSLILISGIFMNIMPEGSARSGVRMIAGLLSVRLITEFLTQGLLNLR